MLRYAYERTVHWGECDPAHIIFFPNYYRWMDEGYWRMMQSTGMQAMRQVGPDEMQGTPAIAIEARFMAPARLGASVRHTIAVIELRTRSFTMMHTFHCGETLLAEARDSRVWTQFNVRGEAELAAVAIPDDVKAVLRGERPASAAR